MNAVSEIVLATLLALSAAFHEGLQALQAKQYDQAVTKLTQVWEQDVPGNACRELALFYRAEAYVGKGDKEKALADLTTLLRAPLAEPLHAQALKRFTGLGGDVKALRPSDAPKAIWEKLLAACEKGDRATVRALVSPGFWAKFGFEGETGVKDWRQAFGKEQFAAGDEGINEKEEAATATLQLKPAQDAGGQLTAKFSLDRRAYRWVLDDLDSPAAAARADLQGALAQAAPNAQVLMQQLPMMLQRGNAQVLIQQMRRFGGRAAAPVFPRVVLAPLPEGLAKVQQENLSRLKQVGLALLMYSGDNGSSLPANLQLLVANEYIAGGDIFQWEHPETHKKLPFLYRAGQRDDAGDATTRLLMAAPLPVQDRREILCVDGHSEVLSEGEFQKRAKAQGWDVPPVVKKDEVPKEVQAKVRALVKQLGDPSFKVRREAREAIQAIGPQAVPILEEFRNDADPEIKVNVRELLDGDKSAAPAGQALPQSGVMLQLEDLAE